MLSLRDTTAAVRHLLSVTADRVRDEAKGVVQRQNLTISQALALAALDEPITMRALADRMKCDPSSVTYVVDRLEEADLVTRTPHPTDRRAKVLVLTDAGEQARTALLTDFRESSVLSRLDETELAQLEALLGKLLP